MAAALAGEEALGIVLVASLGEVLLPRKSMS